MATSRHDDIHAFRAFIDEQLANDTATLTPAEALDLWEIQNPGEDEEQETVEAIRRGLADLEASRMRPAREAVNELRRKYNLPGTRSQAEGDGHSSAYKMRAA